MSKEEGPEGDAQQRGTGKFKKFLWRTSGLLLITSPFTYTAVLAMGIARPVAIQEMNEKLLSIGTQPIEKHFKVISPSPVPTTLLGKEIFDGNITDYGVQKMRDSLLGKPLIVEFDEKRFVTFEKVYYGQITLRKAKLANAANVLGDLHQEIGSPAFEAMVKNEQKNPVPRKGQNFKAAADNDLTIVAAAQQRRDRSPPGSQP